MSELVKRLEYHAKRKGLTFNRIERALGLGNGTIKRWNEQSPRLDKLITVAQYLGVSLDYLVFGTLQTDCPLNGEFEFGLSGITEAQGLLCDGSPLSNLEADLIAMFRLLPEEEREDVFDIVHLKYKRRVEHKKESIYWTYFDEDSGGKSDPAGTHEARGGIA